MRPHPLVIGLATTLLMCGCSDTKWSLLRKDPDNVRVAGGDTPKADDLIAYLNAVNQRLTTLECKEVELNIKSGIQEFGAEGKMVCQKPLNFRLVANVIGNPQADIGSNQNEFWYWIAKNDPPYLVHCSYQDLQRGNVRIPFPFQPEWAMEAMGMAEYKPGQYQVAKRGNKYELIGETVSQGQRVQKVTVFNSERSNVQVTDHQLRTPAGKVICSAHIKDAQIINGAVVPRKITFAYPAEKLELSMTLFASPKQVTVNREISAEQTSALFTRPKMEGIQSYDLARGLNTPSQLQRAGATVPTR
jgi:hypothetical protein